MRLTALRNQLLFHATCEDITGPLRGGGYDKILWTAEDSAIAQTYIPESGITTYQHIAQYALNNIARPNRGIVAIAGQMGYSPTIYDQDKCGEPTSWSWQPQPLFMRDIDQYLRSQGYTPENDIYKLKSSFENGQEVYYPADYNMPGQLYILFGKENLKIFDYSGDGEGDLLDPQYNHSGIFEELRTSGYDAVRINDFAQTQKYGNVGHISIGLFPSGLKKVCYVDIPATNHNWDRDTDTPEFLTWVNKWANKVLRSS